MLTRYWEELKIEQESIKVVKIIKLLSLRVGKYVDGEEIGPLTHEKNTNFRFWPAKNLESWRRFNRCQEKDDEIVNVLI